MHISTLLLGLAATASAIVIRRSVLNSCGGIYVVCIGANPDWCCGDQGGGYPSIEFVAIPRGWTVAMRAHYGPNCGAVKQSGTAKGPVDWCMYNGPFGGGGYSIVSTNSKRDECFLPRGPDEGSNVQCQKADAIGLNGTEVAIDHLSEQEQLQLVEFAKSSPYDFSVIEGKIASIVKARK